AHITEPSLLPIAVVQNAPSAIPLLGLFLLAYGVAFGGYLAFCRSAMPSARVVWCAFALAAVAMIAMPFFPTTDPYAYALYALEAGPLHLNPYVSQPVGAFANGWGPQLAAIFPDPNAYVRYCNYGPFATAGYGLLAIPFAHAPLGAFLYAERIFGALCVAFTGFVLSRTTAGDVVDGSRRAALFILNPLVLFELIAFAHGDALMFALLALAWRGWRLRAYMPAAFFCFAAMATRSVAVVPLALLFVAAVRDKDKRSVLLSPRADVMLGVTLAWGLTIFTCVIMWGWHSLSFGSAPAFNAFSAPLVFLTRTIAPHAGLAFAVTLQAAFGAVVAALLLARWWRKRDSIAPAFLPFAALAGLPTIYPHYLTWVGGVRSVVSDERFARVANVAMLVAPLWYLVKLNVFPFPGPPPAAFVFVLVVTWGTVLVVLRYPAARASGTSSAIEAG
ncbi:MAG: hypothetical protein GIW95_04845, partial [Candidatus Eremiobacteraeota bacterium]|nr:hypothetical protein [Candidatus Eremiobacteraeota bacterium]